MGALHMRNLSISMSAIINKKIAVVVDGRLLEYFCNNKVTIIVLNGFVNEKIGELM